MKDPQLCFEEALVKKVESWVLNLSTVSQLEDIKTKMPDRDLCMCILHFRKGIWAEKANLEIISLWLQLHTQSWINCLGGEYRVREEGLRFTLSNPPLKCT